MLVLKPSKQLKQMVFRKRNFHLKLFHFIKFSVLMHHQIMKKRLTQLFLFLLSFVIVALAQPDWSRSACIIASCMGYALFWKGMLISGSKKGRFCLATFWFALVMTVHLNWFLADRYVGNYIYIFLVLLSRFRCAIWHHQSVCPQS